MSQDGSRVGLIVGLVATAALGCDSFGDTPKRTYDNTGTVCLTLASGVLQIDVRFPTCLSGSCDRALPTSCKAVVNEGVITLTSHGASESTDESSCTDDCGSLTAQCSIALEPGDYTLNHGDDSAPVTLSSMRTCVFER